MGNFEEEGVILITLLWFSYTELISALGFCSMVEELLLLFFKNSLNISFQKKIKYY